MAHTKINRHTPTPWGKIQHIRQRAEGIYEVATASHGGIGVVLELNELIDEAVRESDGWYEQDCKWVWVALRFPEAFQGLRIVAESTAKNYYPHQYQTVTGKAVTLRDSRVLQHEKFEVDSVGRFVARSAFGSWAPWVPAGMVGVYAERTDGSEIEQGYFLVPKTDYKKRTSTGGFVIDETRHERVEHPGATTST